MHSIYKTVEHLMIYVANAWESDRIARIYRFFKGDTHLYNFIIRKNAELMKAVFIKSSFLIG